MTLSFKYRLLCGSVVVSPPFLYQEWFYSFFAEKEAFVQVDFDWQQLPEILFALENDPALQLHFAQSSQQLARTYLSPSAVRCYWRRLLDLAAHKFPKPVLDERAVPFGVLLALGADSLPTSFSHQTSTTVSNPTEKERLDFAIMNSGCGE